MVALSIFTASLAMVDSVVVRVGVVGIFDAVPLAVPLMVAKIILDDSIPHLVILNNSIAHEVLHDGITHVVVLDDSIAHVVVLHDGIAHEVLDNGVAHVVVLDNG